MAGLQAQKLGLVDRLGGISEALACASRMANLPETNVVAYPKPVNPYEKLLRNLGGEIRTSMVKEELGEQYHFYQVLKGLTRITSGVQAKLPCDFIIE